MGFEKEGYEMGKRRTLETVSEKATYASSSYSNLVSSYTAFCKNDAFSFHNEFSGRYSC